MIIVSDTSPITNLIQIGHIDLLKQLFQKIIIPERVSEELYFYENHKEIIESRNWIVVKGVANRLEVEKLKRHLDSGESEAIVLAQEMKVDFLIVDERKGRKVAEEHGLNCIGLLGVLILGKKKGYLYELKPILDELIEDIGFRFSEMLYQRILSEVNEH